MGGTGAAGDGAASRYGSGSGSDQMMWLLAAPLCNTELNAA
jgi:hypothetical protein